MGILAATWNWTVKTNKKNWIWQGRGWTWKPKLVWSSFVFSLEIFSLVLLWPSPKTTSSQIAFRAFTLYELNVCAVYMQACAKWIKNWNKNEKESEKWQLFVVCSLCLCLKHGGESDFIKISILRDIHECCKSWCFQWRTY